MPETSDTHSRGAKRRRWLLRGILVALVAAAVAGLLYVIDMLHQIRYTIAQNHVRNLCKDLRTFHARFGHYPSKQKGFRALMDVGFLENLPRDTWNHPYRYRLEGGVPVVESYGADSAPGGTGYDADISQRVEPLD